MEESGALIRRCETNFEGVVNDLHIMDRTVVRKKSSYDLNFLGVLHIPEEDHLVAVNGYYSVPCLISYYGKHIREFASLGLRDLYLLNACLYVRLAKWGRLL